MLAAVAATPWAVTASIGVAGMSMLGGDERSARPMIELLVAAADAAMYEAKRAGATGSATGVRGSRCRKPTRTAPASRRHCGLPLLEHQVPASGATSDTTPALPTP